MTDVRGRVWRGGKPQDDFVFSSISDYLVEDDTLVWCDIFDPDESTLADLAQELGLNSWAVEDAVGEAERTKAVVLSDAHLLHGLCGVAQGTRRRLGLDTRGSPHLRVRAAAVGPHHRAAVAVVRHRHRLAAFRRAGGQSTASARWCTACSTSSSTSISSRAGARRRYRVARGRSVREQHASGWVASARLSGCARTWSSCAGWCYLCARSSTQFSIAARREDRAGARPAVRRPVRPCAAGVRVDGVAAGHGHDGVRDEPT